jgi:hypothetical protein
MKNNINNGPYRSKIKVDTYCQSDNCIGKAKYFYPATPVFDVFYMCEYCVNKYELGNILTGQNSEIKELYPKESKSFFSKLWFGLESLVK